MNPYRAAGDPGPVSDRPRRVRARREARAARVDALRRNAVSTATTGTGADGHRLDARAAQQPGHPGDDVAGDRRPGGGAGPDGEDVLPDHRRARPKLRRAPDGELQLPPADRAPEVFAGAASEHERIHRLVETFFGAYERGGKGITAGRRSARTCRWWMSRWRSSTLVRRPRRRGPAPAAPRGLLGCGASSAHRPRASHLRSARHADHVEPTARSRSSSSRVGSPEAANLSA